MRAGYLKATATAWASPAAFDRPRNSALRLTHPGREGRRRGGARACCTCALLGAQAVARLLVPACRIPTPGSWHKLLLHGTPCRAPLYHTAAQHCLGGHAKPSLIAWMRRHRRMKSRRCGQRPPGAPPGRPAWGASIHCNCVVFETVVQGSLHSSGGCPEISRGGHVARFQTPPIALGTPTYKPFSPHQSFKLPPLAQSREIRDLAAAA